MHRLGICCAHIIIAACSRGAPRSTTTPPQSQPRFVETKEVTVPIPEGYKDTTAAMKLHIQHVDIALEGPRKKGAASVIVFSKAVVRSGPMDEASCAQRGQELLHHPPHPDGKKAVLRGTAVVTWTGGTGCEYDLLTPDGIPTLNTEFHEPSDPDEIWTMICQHDDGDQAAIAACRSARAGFRKK